MSSMVLELLSYWLGDSILGCFKQFTQRWRSLRDTVTQHNLHVLSSNWIMFHQMPVMNPYVRNIIQLQIDIYASYSKMCGPKRIAWILLEHPAPKKLFHYSLNLLMLWYLIFNLYGLRIIIFVMLICFVRFFSFSLNIVLCKAEALISILVI